MGACSYDKLPGGPWNQDVVVAMNRPDMNAVPQPIQGARPIQPKPHFSLA